MFVILLAVVASLFAIYFHGAIAGIAIGFIVAVCLAMLYVDAPSMFNPTSSGNPSARAFTSYLNDRDFWSAFAICFFIYAMGSFAADLCIQWYKTGNLNYTGLYIWLAVSIIPPLAYRAYEQVIDSRQAQFQKLNFMNIDFNIYHYEEMPILIEELVFKSSKESINSKFRSFHQATFIHSPSVEDEIKEEDILQLNQIFRSSYSSSGLQIPINTESIDMSWYSIMENKYYYGEIRFPIKKLKFVEASGDATNELAHIKGKVELQIHPQGRTVLYNNLYGDKDIIQRDSHTAISPISKPRQEALLEKFVRASQGRIEYDNLLKVMDEYQQSDYLEGIYKIQQ